MPFLQTYNDPVDKDKEFEPVFARTTDTAHIGLPILFDDFLKLEKIAGIINKLKLTNAEIEFFLSNAVITGCTDLNTIPVTEVAGNFNSFEVLIRIARGRDVLPLGLPDYVDILETARKSTAFTLVNDKQEWIDQVSTRTQWDKPTLEALVGDKNNNNNAGSLKKTFPADFHNGEIILQLKNCIDTLNNLGIKPDIIDFAIQEDPDDPAHTAAKSIKSAAKAKYDEYQWSKIAKPLRDELREKQREALVAYVVAHSNFDPPANKFERWKDSNELYDYLLIDVEMKPISITSRIKQAICSVQLFVDKLLMNTVYENTNPTPPNSPLQIASEEATEWKTWRKLYRVWEANRKIFLYPENWIEESLRDNKTPFFKTLETTLKQNELSVDNLEDAFHGYLENLDEVARLEVVGLYHETELPVTRGGELQVDRLHVFARTYAHPSKYFYRTLENCSSEQKEWTAWRRVEVDIDGTPVPVIFNRRLCLFWLFFTHQSVQGKAINAGSGPVSGSPVYWKIQIAWSEYRKGKWSAKRLSKNFIESQHFNDFNHFVPAPGTAKPGDPPSWDLTGPQALEEFKNILAISTKVTGQGQLIINLKNSYGFISSTRIQEKAAFVFNDTNSDPMIDFNMAFQIPNRTAENTLHSDFMEVAKNDDQAFILQTATTRLESQILDHSRQKEFKLVISNDEWEPYDEHFFFQDSKNTFYVERKLVPFRKMVKSPNEIDFTDTGKIIRNVWDGYGDAPPPPAPGDPEEFFRKQIFVTQPMDRSTYNY